MVYTITLSPSIDYYVEVSNFKAFEINRSFNEKCLPGGKGINVSIVLNRLEVDTLMLGFIGGFSGRFVQDELDKLKLKHNFTKINGNTRINVKIQGACETAINGSSPNIHISEFNDFLKSLDVINEGDVLVLSGSVPSSISLDMYKDLLNKINERKALFILDTSGKYLEMGVNYHPFLVKPNKEELEELYHVIINSDDEIICYAKSMIVSGARNVIVSLGSKGAILVSSDNKVYKVNALKGNVINTVGAGDSLIAGFIYEYLNSANLYKALEFGVELGSLTAFSKELVKTEDINHTLR